MKILKILFILLVPAMGFVGCQKSDMKPGCGTQNTTTPTEVTDPANNTAAPATGSEATFNNARIIDPSTLVDDEGTTIVGSGDDDRDGGDKKKKR